MLSSNLRISGVTLALISAVLFGASTPLSKYLLIEIEPLLLAGLRYLVSGLGIGIILIVKIMLAKPNTIQRIHYHDLKWLMLTTLLGGIIGPILLMQGLKLTTAFLSLGVSLVCFVIALRNIGTARTSAYFSSAPFIGAILLAEPFTFQLLLACIFMAIGVWIHLTERHDHEHTREELIQEHSHIHGSTGGTTFTFASP